ncbi:MAG TPA: YggT family protein [Usitatibacter sp.]|nr:YggT family protein [Usitatibacter sp.]
MTEAIHLILDALFSLFILAALVRFWMQAFRAPTRNTIAQFTMAFTDFAVKPLRRVVPGLLNLDWASLIVAFVAELILQVLVVLLFRGAVAGEMFPVLLFIAFVKLIRLTIYVFMGAIIIQAVLSWVAPRGQHPMEPFFNAMTRPFLGPFQRAVPPIGGLDITPLLALIAFQLVLMLPVGWLEGHAVSMLRALQ